MLVVALTLKKPYNHSVISGEETWGTETLSW